MSRRTGYKYDGVVIEDKGRPAVGTQAWGRDTARERYSGINRQMHENAKGAKGDERFAFGDPNFNTINTRKTTDAQDLPLTHNDVPTTGPRAYLRGASPNGGQDRPGFIAGYRSPVGGPAGYAGARSVEDKSQSGHPPRGEMSGNKVSRRYRGGE